MVRNYQINPIYGSLGGVVIFGLWAFLVGQVLLLGAQVAATYEQVFIARRPGSEDDAFISSARRRVQMTRLPDVAAEAENLLGELDAGPETDGSSISTETFNVIVLGGARLSPALAERFGVEARGLVPVAGRLSIEWVLDALQEVPEFSQIVIIGNRDAYVHSPAGPRVKGVVEETPDMALNLLRAIRILGDGRRILITEADTPLVTPATLQALLGQCDPEAELCYPVTRPAEPVRRYRLRHYAFLPLRDGRVAHTCHLLVQPALVLRHQEFADRYLSPHRDLVAAAGDIGAMLMVRYLLGWYIPALRYDLASASHSIEAVTGAEKCQAIASPHPEIALSLETLSDLQEAEARLQAR